MSTPAGRIHPWMIGHGRRYPHLGKQFRPKNTRPRQHTIIPTIKKRPRRSNSQSINYSDSRHSIGDIVSVRFYYENSLCKYCGTITGFDEEDFLVLFDHDNQTWKCYLDGKIVRAYLDGLQGK